MWESNSLTEGGHVLVPATSSNHHLTAWGGTTGAHHWFPQPWMPYRGQV